jgi:hypothetical protein
VCTTPERERSLFWTPSLSFLFFLSPLYFSLCVSEHAPRVWRRTPRQPASDVTDGQSQQEETPHRREQEAKHTTIHTTNFTAHYPPITLRVNPLTDTTHHTTTTHYAMTHTMHDARNHLQLGGIGLQVRCGAFHRLQCRQAVDIHTTAGRRGVRHVTPGAAVSLQQQSVGWLRSLCIVCHCVVGSSGVVCSVGEEGLRGV